MKYFTKNQYNDIVIVDIEFKLSDSALQHYTALSEQQLQYLEEHPDAAPYDVKNCILESNNAIMTSNYETVNDDLSGLKIDAKRNISEIALSTAKLIIPDYKVLNAQMSLAVEDGKGIYTHEEANEIVIEYNEIGEKCRNKYYEFADAIDKLESRDEINSLIEVTEQWFNELLK